MRTRAGWTLCVAAAIAACGDPPPAPRPKPTSSAAEKTADSPAPSRPETTPEPEPPTSETTPPAFTPTIDSPFVRGLATRSDTGVVWIDAPPFIVGQEYPIEDVRDTKRVTDADGYVVEAPIDGTSNPAKVRQNAVRVARARSLAERNARLAAEALRHFREVVGGPLHLPDVAAKPIHLLALWTEESWDRWANGPGASTHPGYVRGFVPGEDVVVWHFGADAILRVDEMHAKGDRVQKGADLGVGNELAHLFLHRAAGALQGDEAKAWASERPRWLFDGLMDLLSAVEVEEAETDLLVQPTWRHDRILLAHVGAAQRDRDAARIWTLASVRKVSGEPYGLVAKGADPFAAPGAAAMYFARAWGFCHFLWHYDGGVHRPKLLALLGKALRGDAASDAEDWGAVEMEFEWHWHQLLMRKVGRNHVTNQWETPSTEAPTRRAQDDPDFVEAWKAAHGK